MKKIILIAVTGMILTACKKQSTTPTSSQPNKPCNCGLVVSDNAADYSVIIRNDCSNNEKTFYLAQGDWMNAHPGSNYCITNSGQW